MGRRNCLPFYTLHMPTITELKMIIAGAFQSELGDDEDVIWLKKLAVSLHVTEIVLDVYLHYATGIDTSDIRQLLTDSRLVGITSTTLADAAQEANEAAGKQTAWEKRYTYVKRHHPGPWRYLSYLKRGLQLTLGLGTSSRMIRWYRVREKALEKVRQRDILRSRILSHQVSMANSSARKSNQALQRLLEQQAEVRVQLEELTRLVTMANQGSVRSESVSDRGSKADTQSAAPLGQQESAQPSVDDEDAQT